MAQYHAESEERMAAVYQDAYPIKLKAMGVSIAALTSQLQRYQETPNCCESKPGVWRMSSVTNLGSGPD